MTTTGARRAAAPGADPEPTTRRPARGAGRRRGWRPGVLSIAIALCGVAGLTLLVYPVAAAWLSSYNQSQVIRDYSAIVEHEDDAAPEQLRRAHAYNDALVAGVELRANSTVPSGSGTLSDAALDYRSILAAGEAGLMARVRIPTAGADLPVYHGTDDDVLLMGAGHLEGSHLPVGGPGTHSVITAHRGLANATMFSDLDQVQEGDRFTIEVFGEVLTYEVRETKVVEPEDTDSLRAVEGQDLVTLITCTPLGINSHRILVTGERVTPTPEVDMQAGGTPSQVPGPPWWIAAYGGGLLLLGLYLWRAGVHDTRRRDRGRLGR